MLIEVLRECRGARLFGDVTGYALPPDLRARLDSLIRTLEAAGEGDLLAFARQIYHTDTPAEIEQMLRARAALSAGAVEDAARRACGVWESYASERCHPARVTELAVKAALSTLAQARSLAERAMAIAMDSTPSECDHPSEDRVEIHGCGVHLSAWRYQGCGQMRDEQAVAAATGRQEGEVDA